MTALLQFKHVLKVHPLDNEIYNDYLNSTISGVRFIPEPYSGDTPTLKADSGDFAKWLKSHFPELPLALPGPTPKVMLHSAEIWLPLVCLAADTSMQVFLNMAASYLYDKAKGALKTDQPRIHMSVLYQDKKEGRTKKFEFSGDQQALAKAIKRFDLDNFFHDQT